MDYGVLAYSPTPKIQYCITAIDICSKSRFESISEDLITFHFWCCMTYDLEPKVAEAWSEKSEVGYQESKRGKYGLQKGSLNKSWISYKLVEWFNSAKVSYCILLYDFYCGEYHI